MTFHVFISYANKDTHELASRLHDAINAVPGLSAWMDTTLETGDAWARMIETEIDRCDLFVVLLSPDVKRPKTATQDYSFVLKEIDHARDTGKPILPALAQPTSIPIEIRGIQFEDLTRDPDGGLQRLVDTICKRAGAVSPYQIEEDQHQRRTSEAALRQQDEAKHQWSPEVSRKATEFQRRHPQKEEVRLRYEVTRVLIEWYPLDWLHLLWWLFITPQKYNDYKLGISSKLFSTLIWLPLLIVTIATTIQPQLILSQEYQWLRIAPAGISLLWLAMAIWGNSHNGVAVGISCLVTFVVTGAIVIGITQGLIFSPIGIITFVLANMIAFAIVFGVAGGVNAIVALSVMIIVGLMDVIGIIVIYGSELAAGVAGLFVFVVAFGFAFSVENNLKLGKVPPLSKIIFSLLFLSYAALIWLYWLNGWMLFSDVT